MLLSVRTLYTSDSPRTAGAAAQRGGGGCGNRGGRRSAPAGSRPAGATLLQFRCDDRIDERHHGAQVRAHAFENLVLLGGARLVEPRTPLGMLADPVLGEGAILDFGEQLFHVLLRLIGDDAR